MPRKPLCVIPVEAPIQDSAFDLTSTIVDSIQRSATPLQDGDVVAISSKYVAISEGRIIAVEDVVASEKAHTFAERYNMDARIAQLVIEEADHIFGGIPLGFLLTSNNGVTSPNAGLDRSNIPSGKIVLLPADPYQKARDIRNDLQQRWGVKIGVILTDSWLMPGRLGTTSVAISTAGFHPIRDERGKEDLFGNPMSVTQVGIADSISVSAQMVMGERDEAIPIAIVRHSGVELTDAEITMDAISIPWQMCIYIESLTLGLLEDGAPQRSFTQDLANKDIAGA